MTALMIVLLVLLVLLIAFILWTKTVQDWARDGLDKNPPRFTRLWVTLFAPNLKDEFDSLWPR